MRTRPQLSARADVGCGAEFLESLMCGLGAVRVKKMLPHPHLNCLNCEKNLGKFFNIFPNFSKKSVSTPHCTSKFFEKISPHCTSPHMADLTSSKYMLFKGIRMCGGVRVRCRCGRKIMMWGEVRSNAVCIGFLLFFNFVIEIQYSK